MREPMPVGIVGLGVGLPPERRPNAWWNGKLPVRDERDRDALALERSTAGADNALAPEIAAAMAELPKDDPFRGARSRRVLDERLDSSDLEAVAAVDAMRDADLAPDDIDLVLVHSLVPDRLIPSNAPAVQHKCDLRRAVAWSLDVGCASFQAQLLTATALIHAGHFRNALLVQSHVGSRSVDPRTPAAPGFGDAAAAMIVSAVPKGFGLLGHWSRTDGSLRDGIVMAPVVDGKPVREWWTATGGAPQLASFAPDLGKTAGLRAAQFCREASLGALEAAGIGIGDVDLYVGNQSMAWFVGACRRSLDLPAEKVVETWAELANVGDAAIGVNLEAARDAGKLRRGTRVLCYSPSAGFTRSAVVLRWWDARRK
jgi:3-oxoacyl-[acyl-carrier-protein] synthase III